MITQVSKYLVHFTEADPGESTAIAVGGAEHFYAVITESDATNNDAFRAPTSDSFECTLQAPGVGLDLSLSQAADEHGKPPLLDFTARSDRFVWRDNRAYVICNPERFSENISIFAQFAFVELQTQKLEKEIRDNWKDCKRFTALSHQIRDEDMASWADLSRMTQWALEKRLLFTSLDGLIDFPSEAISAAGRRALTEMFIAARLRERLELIDDQIEVFEDTCEIANDRLSDYKYYRSEFKLEIWIIVLLVLEVLVMLLDFIAHKAPGS